MAKTNTKTKTIVNFILDKSGSMGSVRDATISGFNEYLQTLKKDKNDYQFTLTLFDTDVVEAIKGERIGDVEELTNKTYSPDGMTALYDAVCSTIKGVSSKKGDKVLTVIMTDGGENSSKEYDEKTMKALITEKEKDGWTFVFLGANQDSYAVAQQYGFSAQNVSNFNATGAGMAKAMRSVANNTSMYAASADSNTAFFTKRDQEDIENTK